jgi:hypothetical protein
MKDSGGNDDDYDDNDDDDDDAAAAAADDDDMSISAPVLLKQDVIEQQSNFDKDCTLDQVSLFNHDADIGSEECSILHD